MTLQRLRAMRDRFLLQEDLNFLLTNRVPRVALTRLMGWFSKVEVPWVRDASIAVWRLFTEIDLSDAKEQRFRSLHAMFTREPAITAGMIASHPILPRPAQRPCGHGPHQTSPARLGECRIRSPSKRREQDCDSRCARTDSD